MISLLLDYVKLFFTWPTVRGNALMFIIKVKWASLLTSDLVLVMYETDWPYMRNREWRAYVHQALINFNHSRFVLFDFRPVDLMVDNSLTFSAQFKPREKGLNSIA